MDDLLDDPKNFFCEATHCKLKIGVCLGRQKANKERRSFDPIPYPQCEKCKQGEKNISLFSDEPQIGSPRRGRGLRRQSCKHYEACLDKAAKRDWQTFNCESCDLIDEAPGMIAVKQALKPENNRICEECKDRKTIHPNSPFCASCMAKRPRKPKAAKEKRRVKPKSRSEGQTKDKAEISSPRGDLTLVIDFRRYEAILEKVRGLAEEEMRPIDMQIIYMLKSCLSNQPNG